MQKNRVNLTCSVCARCGDEVLCGAENAVFGRGQTSACEQAKNCAQMDPNRLTCLIGHGNRSLTSKIGSLLPSRSSAAARLLARSHVHATLPCARGLGVMHAGRISTVNQNRHSSSEIARRSEYSHSQSTHAAHFPVALAYSSPFWVDVHRAIRVTEYHEHEAWHHPPCISVEQAVLFSWIEDAGGLAVTALPPGRNRARVSDDTCHARAQLTEDLRRCRVGRDHQAVIRGRQPPGLGSFVSTRASEVAT